MVTRLLLVAAVMSEVAGSLSLKSSAEHPMAYAVVAIGYSATFVLLSAVLRRGMPLSVAYGVWTALGVAATAVLSTLIFREPLTAVMGLGLLLMIAGVIQVEAGRRPIERRDESY